MCPKIRSFVAVFLVLLTCSVATGLSIAVEEDDGPLGLYPKTSAERPRISSPHRLPDGTEMVIARLGDGSWTVAPTTGSILIAIAFIFGLGGLEEIEAAFPGQFHEMLSSHFTPSHLPDRRGIERTPGHWVSWKLWHGFATEPKLDVHYIAAILRIGGEGSNAYRIRMCRNAFRRI